MSAQGAAGYTVLAGLLTHNQNGVWRTSCFTRNHREGS
jgi:hypothetical protein